MHIQKGCIDTHVHTQRFACSGQVHLHHTEEFKEAMKVGAKLGVLNIQVKGKVRYSSVNQIYILTLSVLCYSTLTLTWIVSAKSCLECEFTQVPEKKLMLKSNILPLTPLNSSQRGVVCIMLSWHSL